MSVVPNLTDKGEHTALYVCACMSWNASKFKMNVYEESLSLCDTDSKW